MTEPVLTARDIHKTYHNGDTALKVLSGVSLELGRQELVAIIGSSGSGKSTMLNVLGLLDPPDQGELLLDGEDLLSKTDRERALHRRSDFGFIFQFYHLLRELNALENIELAGRMSVEGRSLSAKERSSRAAELLEKVGLEERRRHRPSQLSGGERQRVAIARALFHRPRVLFCDEPTGNLDRETGKRVWALIETLREEGDCGFLLVTHDVGLAASADRVMNLDDGVLKLRDATSTTV